MRSLNLGSETKVETLVVYNDYDWTQVESQYNFVLADEATLDSMFNNIADNVNDITTIELVFDFEEEFKGFRDEVHNVVEYVVGAKAMENEFFKMFGIRNEVIEGRYLRLTATKKLIVEKMLEAKDYPVSNKKIRVAMKTLLEGGNN